MKFEDAISAREGGPWRSIGSLTKSVSQFPCRTAIFFDVVGLLGKSLEQRSRRNRGSWAGDIRSPREVGLDLRCLKEHMIGSARAAYVSRLRRVAVSRAYHNWSGPMNISLHESACAAGIEPIQLTASKPGRFYLAKQASDIQITVDAISLSHTHLHVDLFVLVGGYSVLGQLAAALRARGREVHGYAYECPELERSRASFDEVYVLPCPDRSRSLKQDPAS